MAGGTSLAARSLPELPPSSRYELLFKLASGGMATVYVGRRRGAEGFWRLVAIKKAHAHLAEDPAFRRMLVEEARLASRIHHPNVVPVLDVEQVDDHLLLVMDYVEGASLAEILAARPSQPLPPRLAVRIALDACAGLAAAHDLKDAAGGPLHLVHRDVSPQNLLVGVDGVARITDFGIAKSAQQGATTTTGALKGKLAYMAPEYVGGKTPDQRSDVFGLGVVIWEALANRRLFRGDSEVDTLRRVAEASVPQLSSAAPWVDPALDPVLATALAKDPDERFTSAKALGNALEIAARRADLVASAEEVGAHVRALFDESLSERRRFIHQRVAADPRSPEAAAAAPSQPDRAPRDGHPSRPDGRSPPVAEALTARAAPRRLAATVIDPAGAAPVPGAAPPPERDGSTLGSGVSRPGWDRTGDAAPPAGRRALWLLAAGALTAGGLAAIGVQQLRGGASADTAADGATSAPARDLAPDITPASTASASEPSPPSPSASTAAAASSSVAPPPAAAAPPPAAAARSPSPGAARPPTSVAKPPAAAAPTESLPPNPYGARP